MDFAWVVDALHRGLKVTREAWRGDPPMYLYTSKTKNGKRTVMISSGSKVDQEVYFRPDAVLDITDWEEYVEPKKKPVFGNTKLTVDKNGPRMGDTMTVEEYQKVHSGEKHTFQDLCDDYLEQQKGKVQINELPFVTTLELHGGEPVCESYPALKKVWTTFHDLDVRVTGTLIDQKDYPYTLCERDVIEQKGNKVVVLAEPGFSQRTVTLIFNENCWDDARSASAGLIHRLSTKYSWDMEVFISLLVCIQKVGGDYSKSCWNDCNKSLADQIMEDMEFWIRENAEVIRKLQYIINQYRNLVIGDAEEQKRRDILSRCEESMRQHSIVLKQLNKESTNQDKED